MVTNGPSIVKPRGRNFELWMLLPAVLGLLGILYHEWWRDEAYTWLVVGASETVRDLVRNLGINNHPRAYYVMVWILYRAWHNPFALSLLNLSFALSAVYLFVRSAPVTRLQAILFSVSFYPLYQYGIMSRSYSLLLVLLFLYCHLRRSHPSLVVARLLVLAALAQVHLIALMAAAVLLFFDGVTVPPAIRWKKVNLAAAALVVLSLATSAWQMAPSAASVPSLSNHDPSAVVAGFSNAFVPNFGFLNENERARHFLHRGPGLLLFLGSWILLWPQRKALLAYGMLTAGLAAICFVVYSGFRWHHGFYFIFMLSGLWLAGGPVLRGARRHVLTFLMIIQAIVGLYAVASDVRRPYSDGRLAASFLRDNHLDRLPLVGLNVLQGTNKTAYQWEIDGVQPVLLELGSSRIYDPIGNSYERFFTHYASREYFPVMGQEQADREIQGVASRLGRPFVVVTMRYTPLDKTMDVPAGLRKLTDLPQPLDFGEAYSVYLYETAK